MKKYLTIVLFVSSIHSSNSMEIIYLKNGCGSCHGIFGEGMGASPKISGINSSKLLSRLKALQGGKSRSAFGSIMISFAKALDENQTIEMANYLSNLKKVDNLERYEIMYDPAGDGGS